MALQEGVFARAVSRRGVMKAGAAAALASQAGLLEQVAWAPQRLAMGATTLPNTQFDIGNFIAPAFTVNGVLVRFGPVFTVFYPAKLNRTPSKTDQATLANALNTIEANYPFSPSGVFNFVSYGLPYFRRLPGGLTGSLVANRMPRLLSNTARFALEEAVPSPTDFLAGSTDPNRQKDRFQVPVQIENNDVLFTLRSDSLGNLLDVINWFGGSNSLNGNSVPSPNFNNLFNFQTARVMFQQIGLPRKVADTANLPFAGRVNPQTPMWMGFADQQVDASGPAQIVTFEGNSTARFTTATSSSYFANGSIQHLSHDIQDLVQFYATPDQDPPDGEPFTERVQYAFRSNQKGTADGLPSDGNADQFTDGGGPAFLDNVFQGTGDAAQAAQGVGTFQGQKRIGHIAALQRSSRASDGTPVHIRMDGTGFNSLDVPDGSNQPTLEFTVFVPTSEFFRVMRINQASLDLQNKFGVAFDDNGFERFITATRRQNFLVPPRSHRAFPLVELT